MPVNLQPIIDLVNQLGPLVDASHAALADVGVTAAEVIKAQAAAAAALSTADSAKAAVNAKITEVQAALEALKS